MASKLQAVHSFSLSKTPNTSYNYGSIQTNYDPGRIHLQSDCIQQSPTIKSQLTYNYKPTALRSWFLLSVAAFILGCIATTEYAIRTEPSATEVYHNSTLTTRNDIAVRVEEDLGPVSWNGRLSPRGMPRLDRDEPVFLVRRKPSASNYMPPGLSTRTNQPSFRPSSHTSDVSTLETITSESVVSWTVPVTPTTVSADTIETSNTAQSEPTPAKTITYISTSKIVISAVTSISTEHTQDGEGHETTLLHTVTLEPASTSTQVFEVTTTNEPSQTDVAAYSPPMVTTFTSVLRVSDIRSLTVTIPEVLSTFAEETENSAGLKITILHITTLQTASTITELYEVTPAGGQSFITTEITSTIGENEPSPLTTLVEETTTIGRITKVLETTTDSLGNTVTTLIDSTLPAQTITIQEVSTISGYSQVGPTALDLETYQQRLPASSAYLPTFRVMVSTKQYTTVVPTSVPTVVPTPSDGPNDSELEVLGLTTAEYFSGAFLSTVLAVVVSLLLEVIGQNSKLMQPFLALASSPSGATAESSVFLRFDEWFGATMIPQAFRLRQPLIILSQMVVIGSQVIAPLSAEAVQIYTPNSCTASCYGKIAVQRPVARALEGLLGAIAMLLAMMVIITNLKSSRTGVSHNPWSAAGMASLCGHPDVKALLLRIPRGVGGPVDENYIARVLAGRRYTLGSFLDTSNCANGKGSYGLIVNDDDSRHSQIASPLLRETELVAHADQRAHVEGTIGTQASPWLRPLTWWFRLAFVGLIIGVLAIIVYYQQTSGDSGFEIFMDSRGFGVRFLFTGLGVLLGGFMGAIFECKSPLHQHL